MQLAAQRAGYREFDVEAAFAVFFIARNAVELFAEVRPALERLARRYTLASLSNGNADVRLIGLDDVFTFSLNAIEAGAAKPEPPMFELACRRLAARPEQIVHVGDDPEHDVLGAARTPVSARSGSIAPIGNGPVVRRADAEIGDLAELEGGVGGLGRFFHLKPRRRLSTRESVGRRGKTRRSAHRPAAWRPRRCPTRPAPPSVRRWDRPCRCAPNRGRPN